MQTSSSFITRNEFSTRDSDTAVDFLRRVYVDNQPRFAVDVRDTEFAVRSAATPPIAVDTMRATMNFGIDIDSFEYLLVLMQTSGQVDVAHRDELVRARPGDTYLFLPGVPLTIRWHDPEICALRFPLALLGAVAEERTGIDGDDLRFEGMQPLTAANNAAMRRILGFVGRELLQQESAMSSPLVADQMARLAAATVLSAFPNSTMTRDYQSGVGHVPPAVLRRADAFIEANADQGITIGEIAAHAGVTSRALQYGFRQHLGTTPMGRLRQVRLERAHLDLKAGDPTRGDTVAAIALKWGFAKPGRFAIEYRKVYGSPPSHTLRT